MKPSRAKSVPAAAVAVTVVAAIVVLAVVVAAAAVDIAAATVINFSFQRAGRRVKSAPRFSFSHNWADLPNDGVE